MTTAALKEADPLTTENPVEGPEVVFTPEEEAAFAAGFEGKKTPPEDVVKTKDVLETKPETDPVVEPKIVQLTEEKYQELLAQATTINDVKSALEQLKGKTFGTIGGLERTLNELKSASASGKPVELSPEDLAELREVYPEMTTELEKGLTRILGKVKGGAPAFDPAVLEPLVTAAIEKATPALKDAIHREDALETLTDRHPTWATIVGPETSETDFRTWLKGTKTPEAQAAIMDTWNPKAAGDVIDEFLEHQKKTAALPKKSDAETRRERMAQGVQPKGSTPPVPKTPTVEDAFNEGFKTGRS